MNDEVAMKECRGCLYWGDENIAGERQKVEHRACRCPKIIYQWGEFDLEEGGAVYSDYEGYSADFATTATFGCQLWEPKSEDC